MRLDIAIITAPRPVPTLARSIKSLRKAGFTENVLVCSDGGDPVIADGVATIRNEVKLGNKSNWTRALALLVESTSDPEQWLMVCEDDIVWAQGARDKLALALAQFTTAPPPLVGAISLFAPHRMVKFAEKRERGRLRPGWHGTDMQFGKRTWGAQCLLFRRKWAERLLQDKVFRAHNMNIAKDKNIDAIVGESINSAGRTIQYLIPCLVDHIAETNSSLGYKGERPDLRTNYFAGPPA